MVRMLLLTVLIVSLLGLLVLVYRYKAAWNGVISFLLHGIGASVLLYGINTTGWITGVHVPLNPVTLTGVGLLGFPGLICVVFLKIVCI